MNIHALSQAQARIKELDDYYWKLVGIAAAVRRNEDEEALVLLSLL